MTRELDAPLAEEIEKRALRPFVAFHINTPDPVWAYSGNKVVTFAGHEWTGYSGLAKVDSIGESTSGAATGMQVTLLRVPSEFRDDLADQAVRGCLYEVYLGVQDEAYKEVLGFKKIWKGTLQSYEIIDGGTTLTVQAGGESRQIDQRRPTIKRFTDEYQQRKYSGDRFFEYVPRLPELAILWAKSSQDGL
ncbi:MAG: hypothetical protein JWQ03_3112 [Variovorax sp.]|nr:hypothetical protein [Variovorax sp.]